MKKSLFFFILLWSLKFSFGQTKVGGYVIDENNEPIAYANVIFKGSVEGTITDENGKFYLVSKNTWQTLVISFLGYEQEYPQKIANFDIKLILKEEENTLNEVVVVLENNPKIIQPSIFSEKYGQNNEKTVWKNLLNITIKNIRR